MVKKAPHVFSLSIIILNANKNQNDKIPHRMTTDINQTTTLSQFIFYFYFQ